MVSRKRLLGSGIADRWVGLLRRHRVESKTAPAGVGSTDPGPDSTTCRLRHKEVKLPMSISGSGASARADVPTSLYLYYARTPRGGAR